MRPITYAVANLGRTQHASTVRRAMVIIRRALVATRGPVILGLVEIDEGDKTRPTDHQLIRRTFTRPRRWHRTWMDKREPILSRGIRPLPGRRRTVLGCAGLPGQSPQRSWQATGYATGDGVVYVVVGHPPAGAHNGNRARDIKARLLTRYAQMEAAEIGLVAALLAEKDVVGVVIMPDRNRRDYATLHPREQIVVAHPPDYISAVPAVGRVVHVADHLERRQPIEAFHPLIGSQVSFPKARP